MPTITLFRPTWSNYAVNARLRSLLAAAASIVCKVAAHGYVRSIRTNGQTIPGWDVTKDPYVTPQPLRVVRGTKLDSGFISDVASPDITCSIENQKLPPGPISATVAAEGTVEVQWNTVLNYMAKYPTTDCSKGKGDTASPWFKDVYVNGEWPLILSPRTDSSTPSRFQVRLRLEATYFATKTMLCTVQAILYSADRE
ncbi:hypothetical protein Hypma_001820 [Hypsizygus marmoreus]|uniref:lytic cellulose monooxygenase (C4-dehydrogenating) n=1 Tax=Hypsizygus marmoreus TaxID=39966 RepID=A0A369J9Q2_HYPMA|nr:hypothetical protein Hypma_001820 [Hypsizygus marmoreus]